MGYCFFFGLCHNKTGENFILVKVKMLFDRKRIENFELTIVGSKITIVVDPSVTY